MEKTISALQLSCDVDDVLNYAIVHNGVHIIRDICLKNESEEEFQDLTVQFHSDNEFIKKGGVGVDRIRPGEEIHLKNLDVQINAGYLASLTEKSFCQICVEVRQNEELLISKTDRITVLAFDEWPGLQYTPELLAAFVMPNHPVVISMIQLAAKYLEKWTGDPSLAGYQYKDPNRVRFMAAAAYAAIQQKNITYAEPPASFEQFGQRIRLADAMLDQHMGTCLDMTLLYVACLEAMGLNPVMVLMNGHIFAGVWLIDESFTDLIMDDPSQLEKRMSKGIYEMTVVECTAMCAGKSRSFDEAVLSAERSVSYYGRFTFAIDVKRARSMGIRPLPVRIKTESGFEVPHEDRQEQEITHASKNEVEIFDLPDAGNKEQITKLMQWERKLLDLSLRNMLINMRLTRAVVPLLSPDLCILEDALSDGEEFRVMPRPAEMVVSGEGKVPVEALEKLGDFADFIALESRHKRLHSFYTETELNKCLTKMYRSARTSMEENGASTLYLALGLLRWFESKKSEEARYAPIVLVPVDIVRKSASKGYAMRMRDEDAQVNITLLEFLKQNHGIQIYGLNPPPMDEHGLDLARIFAMIRHALMELPMWDVVEVGFIGNFSFSQFVMWNDIHSNSAFLEKNKIVRSLMSGAVEWDCRIPGQIETEEAYLPVTVDASQLRAINMAAAGVSFVLHGPPGTGKSQTITAMIANALTKGKTILFVAEKMAALEVVQRRLASLGIGDFCLELHSNKATKKAVLDQLRRGLEIRSYGTKTDYDKKIRDIRAMRDELDAYAKALHVKRSFGKSLRQLIDFYETIPESEKSVRFEHSYAASLTESDLDDQKQSLERLVAAGRGIGHPHNHPLQAVRQTEYSQRLKFDLEAVLEEYKAALEEFRKETFLFADLMGIPGPATEEEWDCIRNCAWSVIAVKEIPTFLRNSQNVDWEFAVPEAFFAKQRVFEAKTAGFIPNWNENFLRMDMGSYQAKYEQANKKFIGRGKALAALASEMQAFAHFQVEAEQIPVYLADIMLYQREAEEIASARDQLPQEWSRILTLYPAEEALRNYKDEVKRRLQVMALFAEQIRNAEAAGKLESCILQAEKLSAGRKVVEKAEEEADRLLDLTFDTEGGDWIEKRLTLCSCILENASSIKDWIVYQQYAAECRKKGLGPVCDAYEGGLPHEEVMQVYLRSIYRIIILSVIEKEPVLNGFTGIGFNEKIAQFKKLDQEFMDLTREEMLYRLTSQLPTSNDSVEVSRELNILRRAISSNGRGVSIRTLFEQIPHILAKLSPCMLMSPISVAQYLKAENDLFDIVIFDEASQLPTCKAVGVLARGRNAVIVGDPNQMPPTSFFAGNTVDEDNLEIEDLDSILDDCLALGMPSAYLQWHYRSRHESLIAFSNQEFYENSMFTFPSVNDREKKVTLVNVDGYFDRGKGRVNEAEARAIVSEIRKRYQDPELTCQTIGVVTFNISQQTLIEDLLLEEYQKDAAFDQWANEREESLFVKNLENVQGDERDVILFSIAFGPDADGKLSLNFGPLNKNGGWKRLNVAVSRARCEMLVFTIMTPDMINLRRTKSKGVESLKNFLEFAQKGRLQGEYIEQGIQEERGIISHICQALTDGGYQYQTEVGHSQFKIDIAVINPYNEEEYLLGIMLDGESYRRSGNTKDREVAQATVLRGLGWELYRIWTMDWWDNRSKVLGRLRQLLEEKKEEAYRRSQKKNMPEPMVIHMEDRFVPREEKEEVPDQKIAAVIRQPSRSPSEPGAGGGEYRCEDYIYAQTEVTELTTSEYIKNENLSQITGKIQQIINAEAPIAYERLVKKTLRAFHIARSSEQTIEATDKALKKASWKMNKQAGVKFYWRKDQDQQLYRSFRRDTDSSDRRSPDEICQQEMKNAVCYTLMKEGTLGKEILIKETIRSMGYARSGAALAAAVERGIKYGRKTGEIVQDGEKNFVLSE